ncbi:MAG: hypothetical protein EOO73_24510 [Myxococcales bacterium]|nr:MAG: hypothetical protein EOO73_24510 [Myxococcales bacterium]
MRYHRSILAWLGLAAATVTIAALAKRVLAQRPGPRPAVRQPLVARELEEQGPDSVALPPPASVRDLSAQPRDHARRAASPEDAEAIGADELGAAFLARATGYEQPDDAEEEDELSGFQIHEGWR